MRGHLLESMKNVVLSFAKCSFPDQSNFVEIWPVVNIKLHKSLEFIAIVSLK